MKVQYYVLGFPVVVIDDTYDLCGDEIGLTCPLGVGTHSVKFSNEIPSSAPGVSRLNQTSNKGTSELTTTSVQRTTY